MLIFLLLRSVWSSEVEVSNYLQKYGYFNISEDRNENVNLKQALKNFLEFYHMPIDGEINEET